MPTLEAPRYYEHSKGILPGRYDWFFRYLPESAVVGNGGETGEVESPLGFVTIIEVDEEIQQEFMQTHSITPDLCHTCRNNAGVPDTGWYVLCTDSNGIIFAMEYGEGTLAEEGARADFAEAESVYSEWLDEVDVR